MCHALGFSSIANLMHVLLEHAPIRVLVKFRSGCVKIHGTTPKRYLPALRFKKARPTLLSNDGAATSPTEVATHFGFRELGRFPVAWHAGMTAIPGTPVAGEAFRHTTPVM